MVNWIKRSVANISSFAASLCVSVQIFYLQLVQLVFSLSLFPSLLLSQGKTTTLQSWWFFFFVLVIESLRCHLCAESVSGTFRASLCDFRNKTGLKLHSGSKWSINSSSSISNKHRNSARYVHFLCFVVIPNGSIQSNQYLAVSLYF